MRDINKVVNECKKELDAIGIKYGNVLNVEVNTRAKKRWGLCKSVPGGFIISINSELLKDSTPMEGLKTTVLHELLHTCKGAFNHKDGWKRLAEKVNKAYGYNIKRTTSCEEKGLPEFKGVKKYKHKFVCSNCGAEVNRQRESAFTKHPEDYRCRYCNGEFKKVY